MIIFRFLFIKTQGNMELSVTIPKEFLHQSRDTDFVYHQNIQTETASPNLDMNNFENLLDESEANKMKLEIFNQKHISEDKILKLEDTKTAAMKERKKHRNNKIIFGVTIFLGGMLIIFLIILLVVLKLL